MTDLRPHFITADRPFQEGTVEVFEQSVRVESLKKATLSITALGLYEAELNGEKVGDLLFTPGYTYYPRHLYQQCYDVTSMLRPGENTLRVYLAQGWYCGRFTFDNKSQIYGPAPAVSWVLELEDENGAHSVSSDDAEVTAVPSPYDYAGFYDGEVYDPRGGQYPPVQPVPYRGELLGEMEERQGGIRLREELEVQAVLPREDGTTILDFGQNFAGILVIDPAKMKGESLKLRHGELLNGDGSLYTANLRKAKAELVYTKGEGLYRPRFTYMGFRYAELSGVEYVPGLVKAYALYSDMERTGEFSCENPLVERLFQNQLWGQRSNYIEVPTDCPQRDERMGYTGDGHVFAQTGAYNFDTEEFWAKFLKDIRHSQADNSEGYVAPTVPAQGPAGVGFMSMLGWGSCVTIVPELLYRHFGTDRYLKEQYESMKAHVECEIRHMGGLLGKKELWMSPSLGDWLSPGKDVKYMAMHHGPVSNAFIVNDLEILSRTAKRLGKDEDARRYAGQLEKTRSAYLKAFVKANGTMKDDYQGAYVMALKMVVPSGELWDKLFAKLVSKLKAEGLQTGFFATEHLLPMLADHGEAKLAYDLLLQENCPGWMYQVKRGATTIWERWDSLRPDGTVNESKMSNDNMVSFNHYAFGSVGEFYYQYIMGLKPLEPGFAKAEIRPFVDGRLGGVQGSYRSRNGLFRVAWKVKDGGAELRVETPVPTRIILPDGTTHQVEPGSYEYTCRLS